MNLNEYTRCRREAAAARQAAVALWRENIEKFKSHVETKVVTKNDFKQAFEFLERLYPQYTEQFNNIKMYSNENTWFCKKLGLNPYAAGLFVIPASTILLLYNPGRIPLDAVVVHECLHYVSHLLGSSNRSKEAEEDFAYYKSIPYLREIGLKESVIRNDYLMPYCMSIAMDRAAPCKDVKEAQKNIEKQANIFCEEYMTGTYGEDTPKVATTAYDPFDTL